MAFRFRRSVKIAPGVRLNIGKKSTSVRIGPKGLGYTISSTGQKRVSTGIPGTGISYSQRLEAAARPSPARPIEARRKSSAGTTALWLLAILFGLGWCASRLPPASDPPPISTALPSPAPSVEDQSPTVSAPDPPALVSSPVRPPPPAAPAIKTLYTTTNVRLRDGPSTEALILWTAPPGTEVQSSEMDGAWHLVSAGARKGWMHGDYLSERRPVQRPAPAAQPAPALSRQAPVRGTQPVRSPYVGTCDCPYDRMRNGRICGGNSAYSRPGGRSPVCFR